MWERAFTFKLQSCYVAPHDIIYVSLLAMYAYGEWLARIRLTDFCRLMLSIKGKQHIGGDPPMRYLMGLFFDKNRIVKDVILFFIYIYRS